MLTTHPFYAAWYNMRQRCYRKTHQSYKDYGGRGIYTSAQWEFFENFKRDMLPGWEKGLELERLDNEGAYSKQNCTWVTRKEQCRNTRSTKLSEDQVIEIRRLRGLESTRSIAKRYGVSAPHVCRIQTEQKWA